MHMYQKMGPLKSGFRRTLPFVCLMLPVSSAVSRFVYIDYLGGLFDNNVTDFSKKS